MLFPCQRKSFHVPNMEARAGQYPPGSTRLDLIFFSRLEPLGWLLIGLVLGLVIKIEIRLGSGQNLESKFKKF